MGRVMVVVVVVVCVGGVSESRFTDPDAQHVGDYAIAGA